MFNWFKTALLMAGITVLFNVGGAVLGGAQGMLFALADALGKIERYAKGLSMELAETRPATAQKMIINPISGRGVAGLFSTQPSTEERVAPLRAMA